MKVVHVIANLSQGGAEASLYRLILHNISVESIVVCLFSGGKYKDLLSKKGFKVYVLSDGSPRRMISISIALYEIFKNEKPDLVQTWMYLSDFLGGLVAYLSGVRTILWSARSSAMIFGTTTLGTILLRRMNALLSYVIPAGIVVCANSVFLEHQRVGYSRKIMRVIYNGYELDKYIPNNSLRVNLRNKLNIRVSLPVLGMVGRYDPYKDHETYLSSLALLKQSGTRFLSILVGPGVNKSNSRLVGLIHSFGLAEDVLLIGRMDDMPSLMNMIDILVLSSVSEGFPNVVCEAMACGTPCVVTDVGDAAYIVGDTGWVVPPKDPFSLSQAIGEAVTECATDKWSARCKSARDRILENFSISRMVDSYNKFWKEIVSGSINAKVSNE